MRIQAHYDPTMENQGNSNLSTTKTSNNVGAYVKIVVNGLLSMCFIYKRSKWRRYYQIFK